MNVLKPQRQCTRIGLPLLGQRNIGVPGVLARE
jgi:hypothetical protein